MPYYTLDLKFWFADGTEEDVVKMLAYIPDQILYEGKWFEKSTSAIDLDTGTYSKIHYNEVKKQ